MKRIRNINDVIMTFDGQNFTVRCGRERIVTSNAVVALESFDRLYLKYM
jgi:hypothetical protein